MADLTEAFLEPGEMIEQSRRAQALELAVQLHVARAGAGKLTERGDQLLSQDTIETAKQFDAYLRGDAEQEPTES